MKKFISSISAFVLSAPAALAQNGGLGEFGNTTNLGNDVPVIETIANIINILLGFLGVIAVVIIIYAGFKWMTSAGNEESISSAKKMMGAAIIGLVIILASYAIAQFVVGNLINETGSNI